MAFDPDRRTNADLIVDCVRLGYLRSDASTLDPTYGLGTFWRQWRPDDLVGTDLDPQKSPGTWWAATGRWASSYGPIDFRRQPWLDGTFGAVVFDPPYKLNGTPGASDGRYGCGEPSRWQDRMALILEGVRECARVLEHGGTLLVKCQDQVVSGRVVWQTDFVTQVASASGCTKIDRLEFISGRPQPPGRRQVHARRNHSSLLVFRKGR